MIRVETRLFFLMQPMKTRPSYEAVLQGYNTDTLIW